ncbi:MAG: glycosyltransferase [Bacteroidota bacterium]
MKISVAMATYNGEAYLQEQLDSLLNQTHRPDEIIITDDKSSDATLDIANRFKASAPFEVKIYENEINLGYTKNFEKGLLKSTGDLVFMSDQDDVWFEQKVDRMVHVAKDNPRIDLFVHDTEITDENLEPTGITKMEQIESIGKNYQSMVMGACTLVRANYLNECLPMPNNFKGHDTWLHKVAPILNKKKLYIREPLQYYRIHNTNTSEYIVNKTNKINLIDKWNISYNSIVNNNERIEELLEQDKSILNWVDLKYSGVINKDIYSKYIAEIESLENRLGIYESNGINRALSVLKYYNKGGYDKFSGIKSMLKDLLV